jgi:hypothetical protein
MMIISYVVTRYAVADNLLLESIDDVENDLRAYQSAGGSVIIESTSCDLHGRKVCGIESLCSFFLFAHDVNMCGQ